MVGQKTRMMVKTSSSMMLTKPFSSGSNLFPPNFTSIVVKFRYVRIAPEEEEDANEDVKESDQNEDLNEAEEAAEEAAA